MGRFARFLGRLLKPLADVRGISLYETTAVVAMTAVVAAVAVPMAMDRVENAKSSKAASEVLTLSSAMQKFFEHTGRWPGEMEIRRDATKCFLQTGIPSNDAATGTLLPTVSALGTISSTDADLGSFARPCTSITKDNVLNINSYLVRKPNADDYPNWQGPYMEPIASDPWDRAYIIHILPVIFATRTSTEPISGQFAEGGKIGFGWIISAGPDRLLQTKLSNAQLEPGSDDLGKNQGSKLLKSGVQG